MRQLPLGRAGQHALGAVAAAAATAAGAGAGIGAIGRAVAVGYLSADRTVACKAQWRAQSGRQWWWCLGIRWRTENFGW